MTPELMLHEPYRNPQRSRGHGARRTHRSVFLVGILLPFVVVEPAPVDLLVAALCATLFASGRASVRRSHVLLASGYVGLSTLAWVLGECAGAAPTAFALRNLAIDTHLVVALVVLMALFAKGAAFERTLIRGYVFGAVGVSVLILLVKYSGIELIDIYRDQYQTRIRGTFKDPNVLGPYLVFPIVALLFRQSRGPLGATPRLLAMPCIAVFLSTYSRGAYVAMGVTLALIAGLKVAVPSNRGTVRLRISVLLLTVTIGAFAYLGWSSQSTVEGYAGTRLQAQSYDDDRFGLLEAAVGEAIDHPLGQGAGTFGQEYGVNPHNLFLGKAVDAGLIPAAMLTGLLVAATVFAIQIAVRREEWTFAVVGATLAGQVVVSGVIYSHHWRHLYLLAALVFGRRRALRLRTTFQPAEWAPARGR